MKDVVAIQNPRKHGLPAQQIISQPPCALLVLGMHRSGTSALTKVLNLLGADLPQHLVPAKPDNELGFWESADLNETHNQLFRELGRSWQSIEPMPNNWFLVPPAGAYRDRIVKLLSRDFSTARLFVIKDPRICRLVPLWREVLKVFGAEPRAVLPLRNPLEVAASLKVRNGMEQGEALLLWLMHMLEAERHTRDLPRTFVTYDALLKDWRGETRRMFQDLDLEPLPALGPVGDKIDHFLTEKARHHAMNLQQFERAPDVSDWVKSAYRALQAMVTQPHDAGSMQQLDEVANKMSEAIRLYQPVFQSQQAVIDQQGAQVQQLRAEGETRQSELEQLHAELTRVRADFVKVQAERDEYSRAVVHLEDRVKQREQRIKELTHFQNRQERLLEEREQRLQVLGEQLEDIKLQVDQREQALQQQAYGLARSHESTLREREQRLIEISEHYEEAREQEVTARRLLEQLGNRERQLQEYIGGLQSSTEMRIRVLQDELQKSRRREGRLFGILTRLQASRTWRWTSLPRNFGHWAGLARTEGVSRLRRIRSEHALLKHSPLFDSTFYLQRYPDVVAAEHDPLLHFLCFGATEGRRPNPLFDTRWYIETYPDVAADKINPLIHYLLHGATEGRDPNPLFDSDWYLKTYPDVARSGHNPLAHYLLHGVAELRDPGPDFCTRHYLGEHPDLLLTGVNPLAHCLLTQPMLAQRNARKTRAKR